MANIPRNIENNLYGSSPSLELVCLVAMSVKNVKNLPVT